MSVPTVSVIIPVHNSEYVLRRCIDSVLNQVYMDFELLLIDDGSMDSSGAICDEYAKKDSRIEVIHQTNGGPSKARNAGLEKVIGTWICFIDSDDWVEPEYINSFLRQPSLRADVLMIQSFYEAYVNNNGEVFKKRPHRVYDQSNICVQNAKSLIVDSYLLKDGYPFCKLYNTRIIRENRLQFDQQMHYAEDTLFLFNYLPFVKKVGFINTWNYNYTISGKSLSNIYSNYKSEILTYYKISSSLDLFSHCEIDQVVNEIMSYKGFFLTRVINSIYRHNTKLNRAERLKKLKQLHDTKNVEQYLAYNRSINGIIVAFAFKRKMFYSMDFLLIIQFKLRRIFAPLWHLWLITKKWFNLRKINQMQKVI